MEDKRLRFALTLRIFSDTEKCFGPGMAELLERVDQMQSLRQATLSMEMAYSKAWRVLKAAERGLGFPLLESSTGGKGGGAARVSERGRKLLEQYERFEKEIARIAREKYREIFE